jgi:hypothetical protein
MRNGVEMRSVVSVCRRGDAAGLVAVVLDSRFLGLRSALEEQFVEGEKPPSRFHRGGLKVVIVMRGG